MDTLTQEYESCEAVRMDTNDLDSGSKCSNEESLLSQLIWCKYFVLHIEHLQGGGKLRAEAFGQNQGTNEEHDHCVPCP